MSPDSHHDPLALTDYEGAAAILGVSTKTVSRLVADGKLRHVPVGTGEVKPSIRFRRRDLEAYLDAVSRGGTPLYADIARGRIDGQFKPDPKAR